MRLQGKAKKKTEAKVMSSHTDFSAAGPSNTMASVSSVAEDVVFVKTSLCARCARRA
jgi:hypothetical protein